MKLPKFNFKPKEYLDKQTIRLKEKTHANNLQPQRQAFKGYTNTLSFDLLNEKPDYLIIDGDTYVKCFWLYSINQSNLKWGFFHKLQSKGLQLDYSMHFEKIDNNTILKQIKNNRTEVEAAIEDRQDNDRLTDPKLDREKKELEKMHENIDSNLVQPFNTHILVALYGKSLKELDESVKNFRAVCVESKLTFISCILHQKEAYLTCKGIGKNLFTEKMKKHRNNLFFSDYMTYLLPWWHTNVPKEGVHIGRVLNSNQQFFTNITNYDLKPNLDLARNSLLTGTPGSGKSTIYKLQVVGSIMQGVPVVNIDIHGEMVKLSNYLGCEDYNYDMNLGNTFNIYDLDENSDTDFVEDVIRFHNMQVDPKRRDETIIRQIVKEIMEAPKNKKTQEYFIELAHKYGIGNDMIKLNQAHKGMFNTSRKFKFSNTLTNFNLRNTPESSLPWAIKFIVSLIRGELKKQGFKKYLICIDEIWKILATESSEGRELILELMRASRKHDGGILLATQDLSTFREYAEEVVGLCDHIFLMKQMPSSKVKKLNEQLNDTDWAMLPTFTVGQGIYIEGKSKKIYFQCDRLPTLIPFISTTTAELEALNKK
jgi:hypothetical protein